MGYYLLDNYNVTPQYSIPRRSGRNPSGTAIIHTAECAMDFDGADSSAENCANFIRTRSDYGSYHSLVDSDSRIKMLPWYAEAWQDTETNGHAVGISAAVQAGRWNEIPAARRDAIYRNMAREAADFIRYMKSTHGVNVPIRRITGQEARNGVPGFCAHGDSGLYRSDPGVQFDWNLFFRYVAQEVGAPSPSPVINPAPAPVAPSNGLVNRRVTQSVAWVRTAPTTAAGMAPGYPSGISLGSILAVQGYVKGQDPFGTGDDAWYKTKSGYYVWANAAENNITGLQYLADMSGSTAPAKPAPAPVAPAKALYVTLPASAQSWGIYRLGVAPVSANIFARLAPAKFGGLTYHIKRWVIPNQVAIIQTQQFGEVQIYVAPGTGAVIFAK